MQKTYKSLRQGFSKSDKGQPYVHHLPNDGLSEVNDIKRHLPVEDKTEFIISDDNCYIFIVCLFAGCRFVRTPQISAAG